MSNTVTVKVYLNDGEDHFWGFDPEKAELTMVMSFDLDLQGALNEMYMHQILEMCFEEFNVGETSAIAKRWRAKLLRSLSKGDVVVVGESAFVCDSVGWKTLTTDELNGAIIWDDEKNCCPA